LTHELKYARQFHSTLTAYVTSTTENIIHSSAGFAITEYRNHCHNQWWVIENLIAFNLVIDYVIR